MERKEEHYIEWKLSQNLFFLYLFLQSKKDILGLRGELKVDENL